MKKFLSPEIKIALVAVLAIVVLFFGLQFLKGLSLFSHPARYQMKFSDISGIAPTTSIFANGVKVGTVKRINYDYDNPNGPIMVDVDIDAGMKLPEDTHADIISDLMGNAKVNLIVGKSRNFLEENGVINGQINAGALGQMKTMIPYVEKMLPKLDSILAHVNSLLADPAMKGTLHNVDKITADLTTSTKQLNAIMAQVNTALPGLTSKTNTLLTNANSVMTNANNGIQDARGAMKGANTMITHLNNQLSGIDLQATMAKVNTTIDHVNSLTAKLNSNQGSLGLLMNDPTLYHNLNNAMVSADSLLTNLKAHPKRYVHFSIFGRKDK